MPQSFSRSIRWDTQASSYRVVEQEEGKTTSSHLDFQGQQWQEWLQQVPSFAFLGRGGHRLTARKETRARGDTYWIAYRKVSGRLTHKYLGRTADITLTRLEQVAATLAGQEIQAPISEPTNGHREGSMQEPLADELLATKFFIPSSPHELVSRPRLSTLLDEGFQRSLTVVSAPAGFGKTTLLSSWVQTLPKGAVSVAWVSLDEQDNDPVRFWLYVFTALDRLQPGMCADFVAYLQTEQALSIQHLLTVLINRLAAQPERWLLVLDDFHLVTEQMIHSSLTYLVEHLPPHLRIILASRSDPPLPLARLRARGQLLEVRADQLRATNDEAAVFLREVMGVHLSDQDLAVVQQRTENWLVGLQLVGLSLQGSSPTINRGATRDLLSEVSGNQDYILDYLTDEILHRQPLAVQTFLLCTSILEQLSAPLCDAVLEQQGSQQVLEQLESANLFIVSLDGRRHWYRYHALFAEALRYRLEQWEGERAAALHMRASRWYAARGFTSEAVGHALLGQDWEQAATLIEHAIPPMLWQRSEFPLVLRWLERLPPAVIRSRPRLCSAYAWVLHHVSSTDAASSWLEVAEAGLAQQQAASVALPAEEQAGLDNLRGELFTLRARMGILDGDGQDIHRLCQQALAHLSPANRLARLEVLFLQSVADFLLGNLEPATQKALEVAALAQEVGSTPQVLLHLAHATRCLYRQGQFHEALRITQRADQVGKMPGGLHLPMMSVVFLYQSLVLLEWNRPDDALDPARQALELKVQTGLILYWYIAYTVLLEVQLALGDLEAAVSALQQAEHLLVAHLQDSWFFRAMYLTGPQVRFWLRRGETERAAHVLEEQARRRDKPPASLARAMEGSALIRLRLAQGNPQEALALLAPILKEATNRHWGKLVIELLILQALARQMRREEQAATSALAQAVHLAEPEGYIRSFVNEGAPMAALLAALRERERKHGPTPYLDSVLAAFAQEDGAAQATQPLQPDRISPREREVLHLLAQGCSNQEIANALVITVETVKRHVSSLLSKLGVDNRTQAAMRARSLGLFSDEP
ncbi:MAG TPA: LuxR C-terminal-related transcriptional regulator [Ktedonobacteraceae bacterium]